MKQDLLSEIEDLKSEKENMFLQIKELNDLNSRLQAKLDKEICDNARLYRKQSETLLNTDSNYGGTNYKYSQLPRELNLNRSSYSPPRIETSYYTTA